MNIRFRIWNKKTKQLHYDLHILFRNSENIYILDDVGTNDYSYSSNIDSDDLIIQQSTGLTDRAGKEIYEGDIVQIGSKKYRPWRVQWDKHWCCFQPLTDCVFDGCKRKDFEIIGNIFENPELLK